MIWVVTGLLGSNGTGFCNFSGDLSVDSPQRRVACIIDVLKSAFVPFLDDLTTARRKQVVTSGNILFLLSSSACDRKVRLRYNLGFLPRVFDIHEVTFYRLELIQMQTLGRYTIVASNVSLFPRVFTEISDTTRLVETGLVF